MMDWPVGYDPYKLRFMERDGASTLEPVSHPDRHHDERLRMDALSQGIFLFSVCGGQESPPEYRVKDWAAWAYREATGREWDDGSSG